MLHFPERPFLIALLIFTAGWVSSCSLIVTGIAYLCEPHSLIRVDAVFSESGTTNAINGLSVSLTQDTNHMVSSPAVWNGIYSVEIISTSPGNWHTGNCLLEWKDTDTNRSILYPEGSLSILVPKIPWTTNLAISL